MNSDDMESQQSVPAVLVTCPDESTGKATASMLVENRLAACVNLIPGVSSYYRWEGKVEASDEIQLLIKTTARVFPQLCARIRALHPYTIPEIIGLPLTHGYREYLNWVVDATDPDSA